MIDQETQNKINDAIKESLPAQIGEELKKVLTDYENVKRELVATRIVNDKNQKNLIQNTDKINEQREKLKQHAKLDIREEEISKRERQLEIALLKKDVESHSREAFNIKDFMLNMSRNSTYRKIVSGHKVVNIPGSTPDQYGNCNAPHAETVPYDHDETIEEE